MREDQNFHFIKRKTERGGLKTKEITGLRPLLAIRTRILLRRLPAYGLPNITNPLSKTKAPHSPIALYTRALQEGRSPDVFVENSAEIKT
ncbi:hypothetical protein GCM10027454_01520 [Algoriphagus aestuariicola]